MLLNRYRIGNVRSRSSAAAVKSSASDRTAAIFSAHPKRLFSCNFAFYLLAGRSTQIKDIAKNIEDEIQESAKTFPRYQQQKSSWQSGKIINGFLGFGACKLLSNFWVEYETPEETGNVHKENLLGVTSHLTQMVCVRLKKNKW